MDRTCFMIQPFDGGRFDKLFEDIFDPAVRAAGLVPYRVDRDPGASIPIDEIERAIRDSAICFAELTLDNPNVWFELGFSIAEKKDLCLVSSKERTKYPFDVQHRSIISYTSDAPRDFEELRSKISNRVSAILEKQSKIRTISIPSVTAPRAGLRGHEIACLVTIASEVSGLESEISNYVLKREMERSGFNSLAAHASLMTLLHLNYIIARTTVDSDGDAYELYSMTRDGWMWVSDNIDRLNLKAADDEIPF